MITVTNFLKQVSGELLKKAPEVLQNDFDFVKENIDLYNEDETIKKYIDTYIAKLNQVAGKTQKQKISTTKSTNKSAISKKQNPKYKKGFKFIDGDEFEIIEEGKPSKGNGYDYNVRNNTKKVTFYLTEAQITKIIKSKKSTAKIKVTKVKPPTPSSTKVAKISPEVGFIKRYVAMDGKRKTRKQLLAFINSLQRAIEKKEIRKTNKYAKEIMHIQTELINIYNNPKVGETFTFQLDDSDKKVIEKYHTISRSEKQRTSVRLISRYIGIHGKTNVKEKAERLLKAIKNALTRKQITSSDPYLNEVKKVEKNLQEFIDAKKVKLHINKVDLKGLMGIPGVGLIKYSHDLKKGDSVFTPLGKKGIVNRIVGNTAYLEEFPEDSFNVNFLERIARKAPGRARNRFRNNVSGLGAITAAQLSDIDYDTYGFTCKWLNLIGDPAIPFSLMFWSKPGKGKSTLAIELVKYMIQNFARKALFVAKEEGLSYTLKDKFTRLNAFDDNIHIVAEMPEDLSGYDVVALDSATRLKMQPDDFVKLKKKFPSTTFILVFQATSDGSYRGNKEWEHEVDVSIYINENGYAKAEKTRFGGTGTLKVFKGTPDHIYKFTLLQDAERFVENRKDEKLWMVQGDDGKVWVTNADKAKELQNQDYQVY